MEMSITKFILIGMLAIFILPVMAQARAELSGNTINIWSEGGGHIQTCITLQTDVPTRVITCVSPFASTCISVDASINITRGSPTNWTNFTVNGCEIRMNNTADGLSNITSWGNLSVIKSNITSNDSNFETSIIIQVNSNFSMNDSFYSELGWTDLDGKRGVEIYSPSIINNVSEKNGYNGITLQAGSNTSIVINSTFSNNANNGIYAFQSGRNIINNNTVTSATGSYLLIVERSDGNLISNHFLSGQGAVNGLYIYRSVNNSVENTTINSTSKALSIYEAHNNTIKNVSSWDCTDGNSATGCIYFYQSNNNSLSSSVFNQSANNMIYLIQSNNSMFVDNIFMNDTQATGKIALVTSSNKTYFINSSFKKITESSESGSELYRQWYFYAFTNWTNSSAANGINVSVWNQSNILLGYSTTNSTGWSSILNITQYLNTSNILSLNTNHTIYANQSSSINSSISWAIGNGTSGTFTASAQTFGDWNNNNTRLTLTMKAIEYPTDMQFITPTYANATNTSNATIYINISTNSSMTDRCLAEICNQIGCINQTMAIQTGAIGGLDACSLSFTQSTDRAISFKVFANNTLGQSNFSGILNITIDRTNTKQILNNPANDSNLTSAWYILNLTINDTWIDRVWLQNSSGNFTVTNNTCITADYCYYFWNTTTWNNGSQVIRIWANDSANNQNYTLLRYYQDKDMPYFWSIFPPNYGSTLYLGSSQNYVFESFFNDSFNNKTMNVSMDFDGINYTAITSEINYKYNVTLVGIGAGSYILSWCGYDYAGNTNCSDDFTFNIYQQRGGSGSISVCGNGYCEPLNNENEQTCITDCKRPDIYAENKTDNITEKDIKKYISIITGDMIFNNSSLIFASIIILLVIIAYLNSNEKIKESIRKFKERGKEYYKSFDEDEED